MPTGYHKRSLDTPAMEQPKFQIGDFRSTGEVLGRGSFAKVYKGVHVSKNIEVAIKVVDLDRLSQNNEKLRRHLELEIQIMKALKHPNITQLLDAVVSPCNSIKKKESKKSVNDKLES